MGLGGARRQNGPSRRLCTRRGRQDGHARRPHPDLDTWTHSSAARRRINANPMDAHRCA